MKLQYGTLWRIGKVGKKEGNDRGPGEGCTEEGMEGERERGRAGGRAGIITVIYT